LSEKLLSFQRRHARANQKSTSHHYSSQEDSVPGFRIEPPPAVAAGRGQPAAMQTAGFGSTWYRNDQRGVPRTSSSVVRASTLTSQSQRSYAPSRGTDLHPSSSAARNANPRYNRLDVAEPAHAVGRPGSSHHKDLGVRDTSAVSTDHYSAPSNGTLLMRPKFRRWLITLRSLTFQGFGGKNRRIHYSGPLVPPGGNMEDMLKEHERQIQQAVRKARVEKEKTNRHHY